MCFKINLNALGIYIEASLSKVVKERIWPHDRIPIHQVTALQMEGRSLSLVLVSISGATRQMGVVLLVIL